MLSLIIQYFIVCLNKIGFAPKIMVSWLSLLRTRWKLTKGIISVKNIKKIHVLDLYGKTLEMLQAWAIYNILYSSVNLSWCAIMMMLFIRPRKTTVLIAESNVDGRLTLCSTCMSITCCVLRQVQGSLGEWMWLWPLVAYNLVGCQECQWVTVTPYHICSSESRYQGPGMG